MWSKKTIVSVAIVAVASFIIGCYAAAVTITAEGDIFLAIGDEVTNGCDNAFRPNTFGASGTPTPGTAVATDSKWVCDQAYVDANGANAAKVSANIVKDSNNNDHILVSAFKCKNADSNNSRILCMKAAAGTTGGTTGGTGGTSSGSTSTLSFAVIATSVLSFFALA